MSPCQRRQTSLRSRNRLLKTQKIYCLFVNTFVISMFHFLFLFFARRRALRFDGLRKSSICKMRYSSFLFMMFTFIVCLINAPGGKWTQCIRLINKLKLSSIHRSHWHNILLIHANHGFCTSLYIFSKLEI